MSTEDIYNVSKYSDQELFNILENYNNPSHLNMLKSHVAMTDAYRQCNTWDIIGWKYEDI